MLDRLTWKQLNGWQEYYELEPFGGVRGDYQAAVIASTIANVHRTEKKPMELKDFMIDFTKDPNERQSQQYLEDKAKAFMAIQNRRVAQNGK